MTKPSGLICEVCQEPIAAGQEVILSQKEMKVREAPEKVGLGLFKQRDPAHCKSTSSDVSPG